MNDTEKDEPCCEQTSDEQPCCEQTGDEQPCSCSSNSCDCEKPAVRKTPKLIFCLLVLLAVIGIVSFKTINANSESASGNTAFASVLPFLGTASNKNAGNKLEHNLGEYLDSLGELNNVAMDHDTVFVYIPGQGNAIAEDSTRTTVLKVQQYLGSNKVSAGLYTLSCDSQDYQALASQFTLPAFFVANKGSGAVIVPGSNVNEYTLLQAFQACCDSSSGCCP